MIYSRPLLQCSFVCLSFVLGKMFESYSGFFFFLSSSQSMPPLAFGNYVVSSRPRHSLEGIRSAQRILLIILCI